MGAACCKQDPIDFEGETNLFHFYLLRSVGKGAFGKVSPFVFLPGPVLVPFEGGVMRGAVCLRLGAAGA